MEEINNELRKALGNLNIEGLDVSKKEYENIARILMKYQKELGPEAVNSLLYALAIGSKIEESKNEHRKQ